MIFYNTVITPFDAMNFFKALKNKSEVHYERKDKANGGQILNKNSRSG